MKASISATETRGRGNTGKEMNKKKQKQLETHGQLKKLQKLYKKFTESRNNMAAKQPKLARARAAKIN